MNDFKSGLNPFTSENLPTFLTIFVVLTILIVTVFSIEKFLIPRLSPDNRFAKWWTKHIFSFNPFEKN